MLWMPASLDDGWKLSGVITDRDICVALATRNRIAGDVTVAEVMSDRLYCCAPED